MEPAHQRFGSAFEWIVAGAFLVATVGVAWLLVGEMRTSPPAAPATRQAAPPPAPSPVGRSVPALILADGRQVKTGQAMSDVASKLGDGTEAAGSPSAGPLGPRHTRLYEVDGTRFTLVFEPYERNREPRLTAIYMQ